MRKIKNMIKIAAAALLMTCFSAVLLHAEEKIPVTPAGERIIYRQTVSVRLEKEAADVSAADPGSIFQQAAAESVAQDPSDEYFTDDVSLDDANEILQKKGNQLYQLVRTGAIYVLGGVFIISAVLAAYGAISRKATAMPGLAGMIVSGLAFAAVFYAADILAWFTMWISSK